ncbi:15735_t:CDS:2, partial [Dentiscutata heterogama]
LKNQPKAIQFLEKIKAEKVTISADLVKENLTKLIDDFDQLNFTT